MTDFNVASDHENEIVDELMVEGFRDPLPPYREPMLVNKVTIASQVTVAAAPRNEASGKVHEGLPFQVEALEPLSTDFTLWRYQLNDYTAILCTETFIIDRNMYRIFTTPFESRLSYHHIPLPIAHFQVGLRLPLDPVFIDFLVFSKV